MSYHGVTVNEGLQRRILLGLGNEPLSGYELCQQLNLTLEEERGLYPLLFSLTMNGALQVDIDLHGRRKYKVPQRPGKKFSLFQKGVRYA